MHLGPDEAGHLWLCGGIAHVSPVMENNLPAQGGGVQSWQRMIYGKHFPVGGRTNSPCYLSSVEECWQFENLCLDPFSMRKGSLLQ